MDTSKEQAAQAGMEHLRHREREARERLRRERRNGYIGIALGLVMFVAGILLIGFGAEDAAQFIAGVLMLGGLVVIVVGAYGAGKTPRT